MIRYCRRPLAARRIFLQGRNARKNKAEIISLRSPLEGRYTGIIGLASGSKKMMRCRINGPATGGSCDKIKMVIILLAVALSWQQMVARKLAQPDFLGFAP
jgi:hypothetical protein